MEHGKIQNINLKIIRRRSRSPYDEEFGLFTLLFSRGRQLEEMYQEL